MDLHAVTDDAALSQSGIAHASELVAFAEALVGRDDDALAASREALLEAVGPDGLVDAAATVGNFQRMVRIADGCGIPLDGGLGALTEDVRSELGIDRFGSSANTPESGPLARALGRVARPLLGPLLKFGLAARDRFASRV